MKEILLTSSALIAVIMVLRWLLRGKVRQKLLYATWLLVALRLLVPIQIGQWSFSLNTLTETVTEHSPTIQQAQQVLTTPLAGPSKEEVLRHLTQHYQEQGLDLSAPEVQTQLELQAEAETAGITVLEVLRIIWLVGIGLMALWFLLTNLVFIRRAKIRSRVLDTDAPVQVRVSSGVPTPCLVGLVRPVIYVTAECAENPQILHHVLTHEIAHLRQWDPVWSFVRCVCLCIYWFNPLVWVAAAQSRRDCELSCDEAALKQLGDNERIAYGKTLLAMIRASSAPSELLKTATSMNESKKQLKERMCFIVKKPRNLLIAAIAMTLVIALAAGCAFTGGKLPEEKHPETKPTTTEPITEPTEPNETEPTTTVPEQTDVPLIPNPHSLFPPFSPVVKTEGPTEAQLIAEQAIFTYRTYRTIGTCCEMERPDGYQDMSQYLTEAQKEEYHNYQYRITCCKSVEEVHDHIDRYIGKDMQHNYTDENLFTDNEGNLYVMVIPTAYDSYRHFDVISQTKNKIVCRACMYYDPECDDSDIFTLKASENGYLVTDVKRDREYVCEAVLLDEDPNYQLYKYGNVGYGGVIDAGRYGMTHFQEDFYCPVVTLVAENIWEITTDYGNGFVRRIYFGRAPSNSSHNSGYETYDYAIALGHGKIAYLDGEQNERTLVICDLFDKTTSQTFTGLSFKAENMPVTDAEFSKDDTQLTLTYYTDQNTEMTVTLELSS